MVCIPVLGRTLNRFKKMTIMIIISVDCLEQALENYGVHEHRVGEQHE